MTIDHDIRDPPAVVNEDGPALKVSHCLDAAKTVSAYHPLVKSTSMHSENAYHAS